jgi:hypothetical protein
MCSNGLWRRVADAAVHLHRAVGGLAHQAVGPVVAHRDLVDSFFSTSGAASGPSARRSCGSAGAASRTAWPAPPAGTGCPGCAPAPAEGLALARVGHALADAVVRRAQRAGRPGGCGSRARSLRQCQALAFVPKHRARRAPTPGEAHARMVGGHVEGPQVFLDLHARRVGRHQEAVMPLASPACRWCARTRSSAWPCACRWSTSSRRRCASRPRRRASRARRWSPCAWRRCRGWARSGRR